MYKHRITVFTPTYNRAYIIGELYKSLCAQSFVDFEWLVIDDGSKDDTEDFFKAWIKSSAFTIRYYKKQNGGKHTAINLGLDLAEGEIFFTMDSDDVLTPDALEKVNHWFEEIKDSPKLCGIVANKGITEKETPNGIFQSVYLDKSLADMYTYCENGKSVLGGERAIVFYTDFHKKYRFPEFKGENFMTEAVIYNRMANDGHLMRFYNDIIWIYEYREDGLTKAGNSLFLNNPRGYGLWLKEKAEFEQVSLKEKLKMYYTFTCDMSGKYSNKLIARSIGAPKILIAAIRLVHNCKNFCKGRRENEC